jgi:hypothetical protein
MTGGLRGIETFSASPKKFRALRQRHVSHAQGQ